MLWRRLLHSHHLLLSSSSFTQLPHHQPKPYTSSTHQSLLPCLQSSRAPTSWRRQMVHRHHRPFNRKLKLQFSGTHAQPIQKAFLLRPVRTSAPARKPTTWAHWRLRRGGGWRRNKGLVCFFMIYFAFILSSLCDLS